MSLSRYLGIGAVFAGIAIFTAAGCGSSSGGSGGTGGVSTGGSGGSTGGTGGGATGGSGGGSGGAGGSGQTFTALKPCDSEDLYMAGTTITVGAGMFKYTPACLKVKAGTAVKFMADFTMHPLKPSRRGDTANSPIMETTTGTEASFTFAKPGFFAYYCNFHGVADNGTAMAGAIWVTP